MEIDIKDIYRMDNVILALQTYERKIKNGYHTKETQRDFIRLINTAKSLIPIYPRCKLNDRYRLDRNNFIINTIRDHDWEMIYFPKELCIYKNKYK